MPVHDWTRVDAGIFHDFHHAWIEENKRALNRSLHGTDYYALAEQIAGGLGPNVLTLQRPLWEPPTKKSEDVRAVSGAVLATAPPQFRFHIRDAAKWYAQKKKAVAIRHVSDHRVVAVLEILSPGNKASRNAMSHLVRKAQELLVAGVQLSLVDLFPPTPRDPHGIHPLVWGDDECDDFQFDAAKPLTCASYIGGAGAEAFIDPVAVADELPTIPLYLTLEEYVPVPLETTYQAAFDAVPEFWRDALTTRQS
jgi:hypothetical protein